MGQQSGGRSRQPILGTPACWVRRQTGSVADWGLEVEELARQHAADFGVPDFVYDPVVLQEGSRRREVSDGLLIARSRGLILQSKVRKPGKADSVDRLTGWLDKQIDGAIGQINGTRRTLAGSPIKLVSRSGLPLTLAEEGSSSWPGVVLVDTGATPVPDGYTVDHSNTGCVVLTHDDWLTLHQYVRSTIGVIEYVNRLLDEGVPSPGLGREYERYALLAAADAAAVRDGGGYPYLPAEPVTPADERFLALFDEWIEKDLNNPEATPAAPDSLRRAIEVIDAVPVSLRVALGQALLDRVRRSFQENRTTSGVLATTGSSDRILFFHGHQRNFPSEADWEAEIFAYATVRHTELESIRGPGATLLLARMATSTRASAHTFVYLNERSLEVPDPIRRDVLNRRGVLMPDGKVVDPSAVGRNDRCPCGSGAKWKKCHMP